MITTLQFRRLHDDARLPTRAHPGDAGMDLYPVSAALLDPGETRLVPVGVAVAIPTGFVGLIAGRSSLAARGIDVYGGIIDAAYRGEIKVVLHNGSDASYPVDGRAIAQLLVIPVSLAAPTWVAELPASDRGGDGFGSSDKEAS